MSWSDRNESKESLSTPKIFGVEKGPKIEFLNKKEKVFIQSTRVSDFKKYLKNRWSLQPAQR